MQLDSSLVLLLVFLALFTLDFPCGINDLFIVPRHSVLKFERMECGVHVDSSIGKNKGIACKLPHSAFAA